MAFPSDGAGVGHAATGCHRLLDGAHRGERDMLAPGTRDHLRGQWQPGAALLGAARWAASRLALRGCSSPGRTVETGTTPVG